MKRDTFLKAGGIITFVTIFIMATTGLVTAKDPNTLFIGTVLDFASYSAPFDVPADEGVRLAVDEINAAGGIGGKYKSSWPSKIIAVKPDRRLREPRNCWLTASMWSSDRAVCRQPLLWVG